MFPAVTQCNLLADSCERLLDQELTLDWGLSLSTVRREARDNQTAVPHVHALGQAQLVPNRNCVAK